MNSLPKNFGMQMERTADNSMFVVQRKVLEGGE